MDGGYEFDLPLGIAAIVDPGYCGGKGKCSCCGVPASSGIVARVMESRLVGETSVEGISIICLSSS